MKPISIFFMIIGLLWDFLLVSAVFMMTGIAEPISVLYTGAYFLGQFIGPLVLIVGATLTLSGSCVKLGAILVMIGCLILSFIVTCTCIESLNVQPLQAIPPYWIYVLISILTIVADVAAFKLYYLASLTGSR